MISFLASAMISVAYPANFKVDNGGMVKKTHIVKLTVVTNWLLEFNQKKKLRAILQPETEVIADHTSKSANFLLNHNTQIFFIQTIKLNGGIFKKFFFRQ